MLKFTEEELEIIRDVRCMGLTNQFSSFSDQECMGIYEAMEEILNEIEFDRSLGLDIS